MTIRNKDGKTVFDIDDATLIIVGLIMAFIIVGHC